MKRASNSKRTRASKPLQSNAPHAGEGCPTTGSARDFLPARLELPVLAKAAAKCQGCPLYCNATQVVFGEGPADAIVIFVGEQPGDQEDRAGKPFVGPSGRVLDEAMEQAGIPRQQAYVTNAVKHFKWEPRGTRRLHAKPNSREIAACRPWLEAEIQVIKPAMIVCLGATAAQSLMGSTFRLTHHRGEVIADTPWAPWLLATVHPSSLLRIPDAEARRRAREAFVEDMRIVARQLKKEKARSATRAQAHAAVEESTGRSLRGLRHAEERPGTSVPSKGIQ